MPFKTAFLSFNREEGRHCCLFFLYPCRLCRFWRSCDSGEFIVYERPSSIVASCVSFIFFEYACGCRHLEREGDLQQFELALLVNLLPRTVDEAKAHIPSLIRLSPARLSRIIDTLEVFRVHAS